MMIEYIKGDLFTQLPITPVIIPHIVNDIGAWGSGFVVPLGRHFPIAKEAYHQYRPSLGQCQFVDCLELYGQPRLVVANMCAQRGIVGRSTGDRSEVNDKPIRYEALVKCLRQLDDYCKTLDIEVHAPKFGSDRAGGTWPFIAELIEEILISPSKIVIYEL
jgi:hypothetical protein